jgi:23S rRNA (adenine2503-C2)-methyltransferase
MQILKSSIDNSINHVEEKLVGFVESRYVRKCDEYFIAYISSQTGCNRGCRFCHLTATKQTKFEDVSAPNMLAQAELIFKDYEASNVAAKYVHYNFMARGEPLANQDFIADPDATLIALGRLAKEHKLFPKFNVSTIMPRNTPALVDIFSAVTPTIYYSIYSTNKAWRSQWMPNAMPVEEALENLKQYQDYSKKIIKFHGAFIDGQNDGISDIKSMMETIASSGILGEFNIVHYNPFSEEQGKESIYLTSTKNIISEYMPVKVIPRVGFDVKASCGMFV